MAPDARRALCLLLAWFALGHAGDARAVPFFTSVQDGPWSSGATWDSGSVPTANEDAILEHSAGSNVNASVRTLYIEEPGTLDIVSGDFIVPEIAGVVFITVNGALNVTGGRVEAPRLSVTSSASVATVDVSGHARLTTNALRVGSNGILTIEGEQARVNAFDEFRIFDGGRLVVRPTGNGIPGLPWISPSTLIFDPMSAVHLDTSLYTPSPGDEWELFDHGALPGGLHGTVGSVTSDSPTTISVGIFYEGEAVFLRVSELQAFPVPTLPRAASVWLIVSMLALALVGLLRRKQALAQ